MGAWGAGSFENDSALDWADEAQDISDLERPFDALAAVDADPDAQEPPYVDVDLASEVIAAAESVAVLMGQIAPDVPEDLQKRLKKMGEPEADLIDKAKSAVSRILMNSELVELWAENDEDPNEWNIAITGLIGRLNRNVPFDPPETSEIEEIGGELTPCVLCGEGIAADELCSIRVRDLSSKDALFMTRTVYCHLSCLNGKLHPRHIIQNWRFDVDDAEIDRILNGDTD